MNEMALGPQTTQPSNEMSSVVRSAGSPHDAQELRPRPIVFEGCAGWLHPAGGSDGVILCGPAGQEELATHYGWRSLACQLARNGVTALRFDYPGTGDSAGDEQEPDRVARWVESIVAAADWLRTHGGVTGLSLIGLRLGATLAALAAPRIGQVDRIAFLNPVISGRSYLRELRLLASTWWDQAAPNNRPIETPAGCQDVIGYRWDAGSLASLMALDLNKLRAWPRSVILMDSTERPEVAKFAGSLREQGVQVCADDFPGAAAFLRDALLSVTPQAAFDTLCAKFRRPIEWPRPSLTLPPCRLDVGESIETPLAFGPEGKLHGVLCRPCGQTEPGEQTGTHPGTQTGTQMGTGKPGRALLILNTGLTHHVGHARLNVMLARALARLGVTSLRMDGAGIGDSDIPEGQPARLLHDIRARPGICAALDALEQLGHRDITVMGLCSGGYLAFHTALIDRRIGCVIAVNTQKFYWVGGPSFNVTYDGNRRATGVYVRAAFQGRNWSRVVRGEIKVARITADLVRRALRKWRHRVMQRAEALTGQPTRAGQLSRWMRTLSDNGVRVRLIYSDADPGLADLQFECDPYALMRTLPGLSVEVVGNADHTLSSISARDEVLGRLIDQFGAGAA